MPDDRDTVRFWLNAAGRYPVLKPDQVLMLAKRIQSSPPESIAYKRAVQKLVRHNLKLIPGVAKRAMGGKYGKNFGGTYTEDVFQCGAIGLMRAAQKFDPTRGYAFSTYASGWIYQAIRRDLYNNISSIRIPESTIREYYSIFIRSKNPVNDLDLDAKKRSRYQDAAAAIGLRSLEAYRFHMGREQAEETFIGQVETPSDPYSEGTESIDNILELSSCCALTKQMVLEYYEENLTLKEIGLKHAMSREQVTRKIQKCLKDLRRHLSVV